MANPELIGYIKNQFALGQSQENIKNILLANGWAEADVQEAIRIANGEPAAAASEPITPQPPIVQEPAPLQPAAEPAAEAIIETTITTPKPAETEPAVPETVMSFPVESGPSPIPDKPLPPAEVSEPLMTDQPLASIPVAKVVLRPKFLKLDSNDILKISLGVLVGLILGIGGTLGWGSIRQVLLKSPLPPPPSELISPSPEVPESPSAAELHFIPYTNTKYSFSMDYPDGWYIRELDSTNSVVLFSQTELGGANVNIGIATSSKTITLDALVDGAIQQSKKSMPSYTVKSDNSAVIGSLTARSVEATFSLQGVLIRQRYLYVLTKPGEYLIIVATSAEGTWVADEPVFTKMFESLKVLPTGQ